VDSFMYKIQDSSGRGQSGAVSIGYFLRNDLKGYWLLDETSGTTAADLSRDHARRCAPAEAAPTRKPMGSS